MNFIQRSPLLVGLNYGKGQALYRLGLRPHFSGSIVRNLALEEAVRYVRLVHDDYIKYGAGGDRSRIEGRDILEVGPGDNLGVALLMLASGARSVTCVDGFEPKSDPAHNARLYAALYDSFTSAERRRVRDIVIRRPDGTIELSGERLTCRYRLPIDTTVSPIGAGRYDIIASRAVLEHLSDLPLGWHNMVRSLRPEGEMWHKVDFRCHNLFGNIHPLYFLTIQETIWKLISRPDPTLNRLRLPTYREFLNRDFRDFRIHITCVFGENEILPHIDTLVKGRHYFASHIDSLRELRPRLAEPFRNYSDDDLLVAGIFLTARAKLW